MPCTPFLRPDTQGVALGYGGVALSGRHIPHKIRHLAAELCNEPCGASIVAHFARKVRGTNLWRIMQRIQLSPHFHLRAPHFASKVSYSASPQWATMLRRSIPNPCQRTRVVQRPSLGRATTVSGPCDVRTPYRVRHQTVASCRSIPFLRFPLAAPPCFFYFHPAGKASAGDKSKKNGSFNTIFTPFRLTIGK